MKSLFILLSSITLVGAAEARLRSPLAFSTNHMDLSADPRADFARFAFGNWLKNNPIPGDKARWGGFEELAQSNWNALREILDSTAARSHTAGSIEQKIGDFFSSALDTNAINAAGIQPIQRELAAIESISSPENLAVTVANLHRDGFDGLFSVTVFADQKNSETNGLYARQGGMSLPSKDYYFEERFAGIRSNFVVHVEKLFTLAGTEPARAAADAKTVFELEKALATNAKTPVELRDRVANYNKMPSAELAAKMPGFPLQKYLLERDITQAAAKEIIVGQPKFFEGLQEQLNSHPLPEWKTYLRYQLIKDAARHLAAPLEAEHFRFYSTVLAGTPEMEPRWQRAARMVDRGLGEALGQLYVAKYYPPEARERMNQMIKNIQVVMRERLQKLDWMSESTRQKALAKFDRFVARIGHPEKWRDYSAVVVQRDNYFGNMRAATRFEIDRTMRKLGKPVDKSEWTMSPPTVNAYFQPTANQIVFPAGILQPPFFDFTLDDAVNYGAIGSVIGHEITHGFDDQGRRYDAEGNLTDWWTKEDEEKFKARARKVSDQFSSYEALPGLKLNGELSLGENIADLGGTSIAFEALQRSLTGRERKKIDGFTPEQRFFLSWAQQWRTRYRDDALRRQVTVGPHSPGQFRAFGPLLNLPEFYDAFGLRESDAMYRQPADRAKIW